VLLHETFPPDFIKVDLEAEDKDEAFEELVDFFCQSAHLDSRSEILAAIKDRESKMSTGIKKGSPFPTGKPTRWIMSTEFWEFLKRVSITMPWMVSRYIYCFNVRPPKGFGDPSETFKTFGRTVG